MIKIAFLQDHPEVIPQLTQWFVAQWPTYYAKRPPSEIAQDFYAEANRKTLPVRLLAFVDGTLAGTITLREQAIRSAPEYSPGLGGLLVLAQQRGQGVGTELVRAGMALAQVQGFERVYATTVTAVGILERLGWKLIREILHDDEQLALYAYDFDWAAFREREEETAVSLGAFMQMLKADGKL